VPCGGERERERDKEYAVLYCAEFAMLLACLLLQLLEEPLLKRLTGEVDIME
jgi:hypothetical protein